MRPFVQDRFRKPKTSTGKDRTGQARPVLFIVALGAWLAATAANAQTVCDPARKLPTSVTLEIPRPDVIDHLRRPEIRKVSRETGAAPLSPGLLLNGLTVYHLETRHRIEVGQIPRQPNCFQPNRITASVRVTRLDVYIAQELDHDSCQRDVTVKHEYRHVAVLQEGATALKLGIENALKETPVLGSISAPDINTALKRYSVALTTIIDGVRQKVSQDMVRRNRLLDTPAAYRADDARCR
jgi:hypothetical protein